MTLEELLAKVDQTSLGELLRDERRRRHLLVTMMAEHPDPIMREIGQQWRDGTATPSQLLSVPEYRETLGRGYDALAQIDVDEVDLDQVAEQVDEFRNRRRDKA